MKPEPAWPADKVERRPVAELIGYARNARLHSKDQINQIAASITEYGWTIPALVDEAGVLIAGHGRIEAAKLLKLETVPVMVARGWSDAQIKSYRLADNQLSANATWDMGLLKVEIGELQAVDFNIGVIGFSVPELAGIMADRGGLTDPDEVPEPPAEPVTRVGDVWLLGAEVRCPKCGKTTPAGLAK